MNAPIEIDDVDKAVIRHLQEDGRMPYSKLGPAVGLSQAAVRQRVQRLIEKGVIQVVAVSDPVTLGFAVQAMIGIGVECSVKAVADLISAMSQVEYVVVTAGRFDLLVEVVCKDMQALSDLVNDRIRSVEGVRTAEIFTYMSMVKRSYTWDAG